MAWDFKDDRPIYVQLMEHIKRRIVVGKYPAGSRIPAVRELAEEASVNPNTMQRALIELERSGLVFAQRTSGRMVTEDKRMIQKIREELAKEQVEAFFESMEAIGYTILETADLMRRVAEEEERQ